MSEIGHRPGHTPFRRVLARALVVAGATVFGTSGAWLLGSALAEANAEGLAELPIALPTSAPDATADSAGQHQEAPNHDPAAFRLGDLDPRALIKPQGPDLLAPVSRSVTTVVRRAQPVVSPVRHVVRTAVPGDHQTSPQPAHSGAGAPDSERPLWNSQPPRSYNAVDHAAPAKAPQKSTHAPSKPQPAPKEHHAPGPRPHAPSPFAPSAPIACGCSADALAAGVGLGTPVNSTEFAAPVADAPTCGTTPPMPFGPASQPGITPD